MSELRNEFPVRVAGGGVVVTCGKLSGGINELSFQARDDLCLRCVDIVGAPRPVSLRALSPSAWESFFFLRWLIRWVVGCLVPGSGVAGCLIVYGADVINAPRASPLLDSNRGSRAVLKEPLIDVALRLSALADDCQKSPTCSCSPCWPASR